METVRLVAQDGGTWRVGRRWLRPTLTLARWGQLVRRTGAGDLTGEISFERSRNNYAGAQLGMILMVVMVVRYALAIVLAPFDALLSFVGLRPWYIEAKNVGRAKRRHVWIVKGWEASESLLCEIDAALRTGHRLPDGDLVVSA